MWAWGDDGLPGALVDPRGDLNYLEFPDGWSIQLRVKMNRSCGVFYHGSNPENKGGAYFPEKN